MEIYGCISWALQFADNFILITLISLNGQPLDIEYLTNYVTAMIKYIDTKLGSLWCHFYTISSTLDILPLYIWLYPNCQYPLSYYFRFIPFYHPDAHFTHTSVVVPYVYTNWSLIPPLPPRYAVLICTYLIQGSLTPTMPPNYDYVICSSQLYAYPLTPTHMKGADIFTTPGYIFDWTLGFTQGKPMCNPFVGMRE